MVEYKYNPHINTDACEHMNMHEQMAIHMKKKTQRGGGRHLFSGIRHGCKQL